VTKASHNPESGLLMESVARFSPADLRTSQRPRSLALADAFEVPAHIAESWRLRPQFARSAFGFEAVIAIDAQTSLYGTGEVAGSLRRNGTVTEVWAKQPFRIEEDGTVVPNYDEASKSLYQAHPWVMGVRADGTSFGVFADTTFRLRIDLRDGIRLSCKEPFSIIVVEGASPQELVQRLSAMIGRIDLPPHWALGYHQSRFSYYPDAKVRELADEFRRRAIPCDVIWIDIHYMDEYKVFTFDPERFPDPRATNACLHERGFHAVWILDPAVKAESGYSIFDEGIAGDHFLRDRQGDLYLGSTWAGEAAFPDFTRPETRAWWKRLTRAFLEHGADGLWLDLNEPSLILPLGAELPEDLQHAGGGELADGDHAKYHNVYGMLMSKATYEAMREARPKRRAFVLSRSNYLGGQRYAATWTGDNVSSWTHLPWSVSMVLNLGLSGQPFSGPDIGGFTGSPSPELLAHWIGVGALLPFSRTHCGLKGDQEPWSFGAATERTARQALERRYRLMPYLYTLFHEASETGLPVARPVFFADPTDLSLRGEDHAFLLGEDILVVPKLTHHDPHDFHLPSGRWCELRLVGEDPCADPALPVLRVRDGAIIPLGPGGQNTREAFSAPITLVVSLDERGLAQGRLYQDSGEGFGYAEQDYLLTTYRAVRKDARVEIRIIDQQGRRPRLEGEVHLELLTDRGTVRGQGRGEQDVFVLPLD
jgi:alpha-glucosidase